MCFHVSDINFPKWKFPQLFSHFAYKFGTLFFSMPLYLYKTLYISKGLRKFGSQISCDIYHFRIDSLLFSKPCYSFHFLYHLSHKVCCYRFPLTLINILLTLRSRIVLVAWHLPKCTLPVHRLLPCQGQTLSCIISPWFSLFNWFISIHAPVSLFHCFKFLSKSAHKSTHSDLSCGKHIGTELVGRRKGDDLSYSIVSQAGQWVYIIPR